MKSGRSLIFAAVATASVSVSAVSAGAQPITSGPSRVEVGATAVGIGGLLDVSDFEGDWQAGSTGAGLFAVFNPSTSIGIEFSGEALRLPRVQVQFYGATLLIRRHVRESRRSFTFWRVGGGGRHEFERVREYQRRNQDLSVAVYPAYDRHKVTTHAIVGWGIQRALAEHVAFRAELDALIGRPLGVGGRVSAGIVVGLGARDRSR